MLYYLISYFGLFNINIKHLIALKDTIDFVRTYSVLSVYIFGGQWAVIPTVGQAWSFTSSWEDVQQKGLSFHTLVKADTIRKPTVRLRLSGEMAIYGTLCKIYARRSTFSLVLDS